MLRRDVMSCTTYQQVVFKVLFFQHFFRKHCSHVTDTCSISAPWVSVVAVYLCRFDSCLARPRVKVCIGQDTELQVLTERLWWWIKKSKTSSCQKPFSLNVICGNHKWKFGMRVKVAFATSLWNSICTNIISCITNTQHSVFMLHL